MLNWLLSLLNKTILGGNRSPLWPSFRKRHLGSKCEVCGATWGLELHHRVPVHIDPSKELDPTNVVTLCGWKQNNCHLRWGHLWSWHSFNKDIDKWIMIKNNRP